MVPPYQFTRIVIVLIDLAKIIELEVTYKHRGIRY
jgi:hypothetical protein